MLSNVCCEAGPSVVDSPPMSPSMSRSVALPPPVLGGGCVGDVDKPSKSVDVTGDDGWNEKQTIKNSG